MAFSIHNIKPLHLYILFVLLIFISTFFEGKVQVVYYLFVILGWVSFFMAVRNFFRQRKSPLKKANTRKK
ncbi:ABC-type microcin C transport system permease subunit YejE [Flavobacterium sp. 28YEA47A]